VIVKIFYRFLIKIKSSS